MLSCDLRCAVAGSLLSVPETRLGMPLTWGLTAKIVSEVGQAKAKEWVLLGEAFTPQEALRAGVLNAVAPDIGGLDDQVRRWAALCADSVRSGVLHASKLQFRALQARSRLGDVTEGDDALLREALRASSRGRRRGRGRRSLL